MYRLTIGMDPMAKLGWGLLKTNPRQRLHAGVSFNEETARKRRQTYDVTSGRQDFFFLNHSPHPATHEVANRRDPHADDEHVKTGPEDPAPGKPQSRRTDEEA